MTIKDFEKKYHNIVLMPFMNENVRVLRNKKTGEWKFFKEEDGILSSLPEEVNNKLVEMYRPKPDVYSVEIGYGKTFEEGELPVFSNFAQEPVSSKNIMRKEAKKACFTVNGEKISLNIANLTYKETTRFPEINNKNFTCFENLKFILEKNGYKDKQIIEFFERLDGYTILFDDTDREFDYSGCCSVNKKEIHILQKGRGFSDAHAGRILEHELLHAITKIQKGKESYVAFNNIDDNKHVALMEGTTGCLTDFGYEIIQNLIRNFLGVELGNSLPKEWTRAYLDCSPKDLYKYVTQRFKVSNEFFDKFSSKLDSYLFALEDKFQTQSQKTKTILANETELAKDLIIFKMNEKIANNENPINQKLFEEVFACFAKDINSFEDSQELNKSKIIMDAINSNDLNVKNQAQKDGFVKELFEIGHFEFGPQLKDLLNSKLSAENLNIILSREIKKYKAGEFLSSEEQILAQVIYEAELSKDKLQELLEVDEAFYEKVFAVAFRNFITGKTNQSTKNILEIMPEEFKERVQNYGVGAIEVDLQLKACFAEPTRFFREFFGRFPKNIVEEFLNSNGKLPEGKSEFNKYMEEKLGFDFCDTADIGWVFARALSNPIPAKEKIKELVIKGTINKQILEAKEISQEPDYGEIIKHAINVKNFNEFYENLYNNVKRGFFKAAEPNGEKILEGLIKTVEELSFNQQTDFFIWLGELGDSEILDETLGAIANNKGMNKELINYVFSREENKVSQILARKIYEKMDEDEQRKHLAEMISRLGVTEAQEVLGRYGVTKNIINVEQILKNLDQYKKEVSPFRFKKLVDNCLKNMTKEEKAKYFISQIKDKGFECFRNEILNTLDYPVFEILPIIKVGLKTTANPVAVVDSIFESLEKDKDITQNFIENAKKFLRYDQLHAESEKEIIKSQTIIGLSDGVIESKNSADLVEEKDKKDDLYKDD